jgi:hypothetical protein
MKVNEPVVEHVYTPTFYFDQLPNNHKRLSSQTSAITIDSDSADKPRRARWYRAAVAPVAFDEATFWQVLVLFSTSPPFFFFCNRQSKPQN